METEFYQIKGPLIDDFNLLKCQNLSIMRELEKLQANYRELIADYIKALDAKVQEIFERQRDNLSPSEK